MPSFFQPVLQKVAYHLNMDPTKIAGPLREMVFRNWYLGFTSFGGPAVHFQIASIAFVSDGLQADRNIVPSTICREVRMDR